jgi:hypothetical protein
VRRQGKAKCKKLNEDGVRKFPPGGGLNGYEWKFAFWQA